MNKIEFISSVVLNSQSIHASADDIIIVRQNLNLRNLTLNRTRASGLRKSQLIFDFSDYDLRSPDLDLGNKITF